MSNYKLLNTTITSKTKKDAPLSISIASVCDFRSLKNSIEHTFSKDIATGKVKLQIETSSPDESPVALYNITLTGLLIWDGIEMKSLHILYSPHRKRVMGINGDVFSFFGSSTLSDLEKLYNASNIETKSLIDIRKEDGPFIKKELFVHYSNATRHFALSCIGTVITDLFVTINENSDQDIDEVIILPIEIRDRNDVISGNLSLDTYIDEEFLSYNGTCYTLNKPAFFKAFEYYPVKKVSFYNDASGKRTWEKIVIELDTNDDSATIFDRIRYCTPNLMARNDCTYHKNNHRIVVKGTSTKIIEITPVCP